MSAAADAATAQPTARQSGTPRPKGGDGAYYRSLINPEGPHSGQYDWDTTGEARFVYMPTWPEAMKLRGAILMYGHLAALDVFDGLPCPSFRTLGELFNLHPATVARQVHALIDADFIELVPPAPRPAPTGITSTHRRVHQIGERDGYVCAYCGRPLCCPCALTADPAVLDHVLPLGRGGPDTDENILLACWPCNSSKGDRTPSEWGVLPWRWRA